MSKQNELLKKSWSIEVARALVGKKIKSIRYMTQKEVEEFMWFKSAVVIVFTDGTYLIPSMDDEGNDGGAIFTNIDGLEVIPTI